MSTEVKVPELPESVADATLVNWHKQVGDFVEEGENLVDLETDKVVLEMPAPVAGVLKEITEEDGATVTSGDVVAMIEAGEKPAGDESASEKAADSSESAAKAQDAQKTASKKPADVDKNASPAARKMGAENNVDTKDVSGSGRGGRVTKGDMKQHLSGGGVRHEERVPMTRMRKRIAERLMDAQQSTAMLTTFNEVNMKPIMDLRKKYQDQFVKKNDIKLGFMSFFVKAAVDALKQFPAVNASIDGDDIIYHNYCDIGIAVSGPRGLVVPILRNSELLGFADIELGIKEFAEKTKSGKLSLEEMTGGTFSITNGGTFGSMLSTPILNPPQSAILGMHNIVERAVVENGEIVIRPMMYLALSYDHRIIDGREAVSFLVAIKNALEDPARMLLNI
ncbi:dihydrolipoyllysine-residue succinyltransferase [Suttonella sp. R2A3]|uniref:dihydrolipoyllysine-residue succinyltransferase n=1 Tax=Suttonella sp. R2A3 TaxID=2908648 RepID=UPI001F1C7D6B|nr:dihydrolipoyllysine-residue succinyltransferase [Suttonella sp. R2A3]UJF25253.1 dihydrolipoyllysine-residue succinyltransferase [Suttonella sp. R2A3]